MIYRYADDLLHVIEEMLRERKEFIVTLGPYGWKIEPIVREIAS